MNDNGWKAGWLAVDAMQPMVAGLSRTIDANMAVPLGSSS